MTLTMTPKSAHPSQVNMFDATSAVYSNAAGVDEAGRGPLAGDVYAAAVILDHQYSIDGLADSKTLSEKKRVLLAQQIKTRALCWSVAIATVEEIDRFNILQATLLAMKRAVEGLTIQPELAWVDGNQSPRLSCRVQTIVKGDALVPAISAASILAKTARDDDLKRLHLLYPQYAFDQHKGYGTALHLARLKQHGPSPVHRRSFAPVRACLEAK
jgi:ribonuclease HII